MAKLLPVIHHEGGHVSVAEEFGGIDRAASSVADYSRPIFLYGPSIYEEKFSDSQEYFYAIVDRSSSSLAQFVENRFIGSRKKFVRFAKFLESYSKLANDILYRLLEGDYATSIEIISSIDESEISEIIRRAYFDSRKIKDSADSDFEDFWVAFLTSKYTTTITIRDGYPRWSTLLAIWAWCHLSKREVALVILRNQRPINTSAPTVERDYYVLDDVVATVKHEIGIEEGEVRTIIQHWLPSITEELRDCAKRGLFTAQSAAGLIRFAIAYQSERATDLSEIPAQRPAPIAFRWQDSSIGLLSEPLQGLSEAQISGATQALIGLAGDVIGVGGLDNAIPNWKYKIDRIISLLNSLSEAKIVDQSIIIRLGIEISAFESRVHDGRSRIGPLTIGEVLTFLFEARTFLEKFPEWISYESRADNFPRSIDTAEQALIILREFANENGILSDSAKSRVEDLARSEAEIGDSAVAEGFSASAENLTAAAAHSYVGAVTGQAKDLGRKTSDELKKQLALKIAGMAMRNADAFIKFAALRGAKWIELFIEFIDGN